MTSQEYALQQHVDEVCTFLEVSPIVVNREDTIDSVTGKIKESTNKSRFAKKMIELSQTYSPLRVENLVDAAINVPRSDDLLKSAYHMNIKKLDELLGSLTKEYCADRCTALPHRCCSNPHTYQYNFDDTKIMKLQEAESGITEEYSDMFEIPGCKYLNEIKGCTLKVSKTPLCLGFMCDPLKGFLKEIAPENSDEFIYRMREVQNTSVVTHYAVNLLQNAIFSGQRVLSERDSKTLKQSKQSLCTTKDGK